MFGVTLQIFLHWFPCRSNSLTALRQNIFLFNNFSPGLKGLRQQVAFSCWEESIHLLFVAVEGLLSLKHFRYFEDCVLDWGIRLLITVLAVIPANLSSILGAGTFLVFYNWYSFSMLHLMFLGFSKGRWHQRLMKPLMKNVNPYPVDDLSNVFERRRIIILILRTSVLSSGKTLNPAKTNKCYKILRL